MALINQMLAEMSASDFKKMCRIHHVNSWKSDEEDSEDNDNDAREVRNILERNKPLPYKLSESVDSIKQKQLQAKQLEHNQAGSANKVQHEYRRCFIANQQDFKKQSTTTSNKSTNQIHSKPKIMKKSQENKACTIFSTNKSRKLSMTKKNLNILKPPTARSKKPLPDEFISNPKKTIKSKNIQSVTESTVIGSNSFSLIAPSSDSEHSEACTTSDIEENNTQTKKTKIKKKIRSSESSRNKKFNKLKISNPHVLLHETENRFVLQHKNGEFVTLNDSSGEETVEEEPEYTLQREYRIILPKRGNERFEPRETHVREKIQFRPDISLFMREHIMQSLNIPYKPT